MNAEIIARLEGSLANTSGATMDTTVLSAAIEEQKRLSEVYRLILARVGRIIESVAQDLPVTPDTSRPLEVLLVQVGDRLQRSNLSSVSDALREADEISSSFTIAKTTIAHIEARSARGILARHLGDEAHAENRPQPRTPSVPGQNAPKRGLGSSKTTTPKPRQPKPQPGKKKVTE